MYHRDGSEIGQVLGGYVPHLSYDEGGVTESYSSADHGPVNIRRGVQTASQLCCKSATKNKTFGELDMLACCSIALLLHRVDSGQTPLPAAALSSATRKLV